MSRRQRSRFHSDSDDQFDDSNEKYVWGKSGDSGHRCVGRYQHPVDSFHPADMIKPEFEFKLNTGMQLSLPREEAVIESDDDDLDASERHMKLKHTVLQVFRNLTIQYNTESIELSPGELFSLCIGLKYLSSDGKRKTIMATPAYLQRISAIMQKHCIEQNRKGSGGKYTMKKLFDAEGRMIIDYK